MFDSLNWQSLILLGFIFQKIYIIAHGLQTLHTVLVVIFFKHQALKSKRLKFALLERAINHSTRPAQKIPLPKTLIWNVCSSLGDIYKRQGSDLFKKHRAKSTWLFSRCTCLRILWTFEKSADFLNQCVQR